MALTLKSATAADGTFSAAGATAWNAGMAVVSGGSASKLVFVDATGTALDNDPTGLSPQFTGLNLSGLNASSIVVTDGSKNLASVGQVSLANGGTGANLSDPNADKLMFWDDSAGAVDWLTLGTNLAIAGTTLNATSGSINIGDAVGGGTAGRILYEGAGPVLADSANLTFGTAAGQGVAIAAGTAATDVAALSITRTNNNAAVATGVKFAFTDTSSAPGFLPFDILGGSGGTTGLFRVDKAGQVLSGATGVNAASYSFVGDTDTGWGYREANTLSAIAGGAEAFRVGGGRVDALGHLLCVSNGGNFGLGNSGLVDAYLTWIKENAIQFGSSVNVASATCRTCINKAVASIADNTATATFTVTVPNAAHSASLKVTLVGSLGAGGAVGANEATATIAYDFAIARTAGVATVVTASPAYGSAASKVAGADTCTITAAASALTGGNGATQTFNINVTIAKGSGSSANHTCLCFGELLNANASGVTIA